MHNSSVSLGIKGDTFEYDRFNVYGDKIINFVLARGLNHCQFKSLPEEMNAQHQDLVYFCEVKWLSRSAMLQRFCDLRNEIVTFLEQKNASFGIDKLGDLG